MAIGRERPGVWCAPADTSDACILLQQARKAEGQCHITLPGAN